MVEPFYDKVRDFAPLIFAVVGFVLLTQILKKIKQSIQSKRNKKIEPSSTNTWFNWEDYYKKRKEEGTNYDVPQNKKKNQYNKKSSFS